MSPPRTVHFWRYPHVTSTPGPSSLRRLCWTPRLLFQPHLESRPRGGVGVVEPFALGILRNTDHLPSSPAIANSSQSHSQFQSCSQPRAAQPARTRETPRAGSHRLSHAEHLPRVIVIADSETRELGPPAACLSWHLDQRSPPRLATTNSKYNYDSRDRTARLDLLISYLASPRPPLQPSTMPSQRPYFLSSFLAAFRPQGPSLPTTAPQHQQPNKHTHTHAHAQTTAAAAAANATPVVSKGKRKRHEDDGYKPRGSSTRPAKKKRKSEADGTPSVRKSKKDKDTATVSKDD
ncbi:hypothetical protein G7046_g6107 [Stylonectria norvegica]|nr:hypothetical protein G7046_g6107 [Stylonectria norvegica]